MKSWLEYPKWENHTSAGKGARLKDGWLLGGCKMALVEIGVGIAENLFAMPADTKHP